MYAKGWPISASLMTEMSGLSSLVRVYSGIQDSAPHRQRQDQQNDGAEQSCTTDGADDRLRHGDGGITSLFREGDGTVETA
jgi:hypothetical protein